MMIFDIFTYDFMLRAFASGIIIAIAAPVIGMFLYVRRHSLIADTLAHVSLAGVVLGSSLSIAPLPTSIAVTLLGALGVDRLSRTRRLGNEAVLAIVLAASVAIATVLLGFSNGQTLSVTSILFGSIITVSRSELVLIALIGTLCTAIVLLLYRSFFVASLDEDVAVSEGIPVSKLTMVLSLVTALFVALATKAVGVLLIGGLLTIPVATALQYRKGFRKTILLGIIFSVFSVLVGIIISFYLSIASGGAVILTALTLFIISLFVTKRGV